MYFLFFLAFLGHFFIVIPHFFMHAVCSLPLPQLPFFLCRAACSAGVTIIPFFDFFFIKLFFNLFKKIMTFELPFQDFFLFHAFLF